LIYANTIHLMTSTPEKKYDLQRYQRFLKPNWIAILLLDDQFCIHEPRVANSLHETCFQ